MNNKGISIFLYIDISQNKCMFRISLLHYHNKESVIWAKSYFPELDQLQNISSNRVNKFANNTNSINCFPLIAINNSRYGVVLIRIMSRQVIQYLLRHFVTKGIVTLDIHVTNMCSNMFYISNIHQEQ